MKIIFLLILFLISNFAFTQSSWVNKDFIAKNEISNDTSKDNNNKDNVIDNDKKKDINKEEIQQDQKIVKVENKSKKEIFINPISPKNWVKINSKFGTRNHPVLNRKIHHGGIDIPVPSGTPIYSVLSGVIVANDENSLNGKFIKIQHDNGYLTVYLHLSKSKVRLGQKVKQGQIIALSGATGRVTGAHLHYEVRLNGVKQNPENYLLFR